MSREHNCHPPTCPGMHRADKKPCAIVAFTCRCGRRWKPCGLGWKPEVLA